MEDTGFDTFSPYAKRSYKRPRGFLFVAIFILLLFLLTFIGIRLLGAQQEPEEEVVVVPTLTPQPTIAPTESITPTGAKKPSLTPSPTKTAAKPGVVTKTGLTIAVLNGSGTAGAAKTVAADLEALGYTVSQTGNADNFGYEKVSISVKSAKKEYLQQLKNDLSANYTIGSASATLSSSSETDAIVIVGQE